MLFRLCSDGHRLREGPLERPPVGASACSALLKGRRGDSDHQKGWEVEGWATAEEPPQTFGVKEEGQVKGFLGNYENTNIT